MGRFTFFDFGPPFDFYDIYLVSAATDGSNIERISLTPRGDACYVPAKVEAQSVHVNAPVVDLLDGLNPCAISEKDLRREEKRCKHCLTFSGASVILQADCAGTSRLVHSNILDRDMFDSNARTPQDTAWTMRLLARLDQPLGSTPLDRPVFPATSENIESAVSTESESVHRVASGAYDQLFPTTDEKPSALYAEATHAASSGVSVELIYSQPYAPIDFMPQPYPAVAKLAHVQGDVSLLAMVGANRHVESVLLEQGPKLLAQPVGDAAKTWTFAPEAVGQMINVTLRFKLNCPPAEK